VPISEAAQWVQSGANVEETLRQARKWNLPPEKLFRYCQRAKRGPLESSLACWKDYITAAQALGYPLHRENVLLPADLWEAHDEATEKHRAKLRREREASEAEARKLRAATYVQRKEELEKKYAYAADGLLIRVPAGEDEIIREGACLKHCVAGYAERHVKGAVTILFLREEKRPNSPFLTIEMAGNRLVQIHGYKNEGLHTKQGRFAPDPRETYKDFLDTWLDWLKNGSKRNKDGTPKLTKGRRKAAELQKGA
jgi:hypothetical protein